MIMDETLEFADGADVSGAAGTALVGDVVDLGANVKNVGRGEHLYLVIQVETAASGGTSIAFELASDAAAGIATDGSATTHWTSGAVAVADLTAGKRFIVPLPEGVDYERYLGILATRVGTVSTCDISAFLTDRPQNWASYPDAVN